MVLLVLQLMKTVSLSSEFALRLPVVTSLKRLVSIYTPSSATNISALPVYVYLHGGSRTANDVGIDGKTLVSQGNIVLVTVEYRQGVFGFLKTGAKGGVAGNAGLMDVVTALRMLSVFGFGCIDR